ncbi:hypothetical protein [Winogradskyella thalassocola]|uniref:Uncharacterized protein n=1 Tax=Winogradskyella thalassocola TaxID=262004 RepID=A0A1G8FI17_9FLAO|nr:hypothetical protein [Winogradskyella thalassocola]SDH81780.1 hypothetical protein SAMN04489796_104260 [Winogradskyella thalassocola]
MFINRITFSIDKRKHSEQDCIEFNRITSYHEELLHHYLPKKVNLGGFGFFSNKLQTDLSSIKIKPYGQCIDYFHQVTENTVTEFLKTQPANQIGLLNDLLKKSISEISIEHKVDTEIFFETIEHIKESYLGFEKKMNISKTHKSRKIKIEIIRVVSLNFEHIICRILNKSNDIIDEWILENNTSIYDCSYSYRKSKWNENNLEIYDRFDKIHKTIDVIKYIEQST